MGRLCQLIVVLVGALLCGQVQAQQPVPQELVVVGKNDGKAPDDFLFRMGDSVEIKATGKAAEEIEKVRNAGGTLTLSLDGVAMPGLPFDVQTAGDKALRVSFDLVRHSQDDNSRKAWDALLHKQDSYVMVFKPSLAIGNAIARPVQSPQALRFYVATSDRVFGTLLVGGLVFLALYAWLVWHPSALRDRPGGIYSLGKSQMAFWGLMVVVSFVGVWVMTGGMERIPAQVLVLLGISGATGLGAMVIGDSKTTKMREDLATLQSEKATQGAAFADDKKKRIDEITAELAKPGKPGSFPRDLCNDGTGMSFHRLQIVIWTLVLGVIFVRSVAQVMSMPEFAENLLILMGISSGTYLGFKLPEKS